MDLMDKINKLWKMGICILLISAGIFALAYCIIFFVTDKTENNLEKKTTVQLTAPPTEASMVETEKTETTEIPKQEEIVEEREDLSTNIEIEDLPQEVWAILNVSEERLKGELKIFLNSVGYATADTVRYAGESTISHLKNTVTVELYIQKESLFQFNLVYDRANDTYSFEQW